MSYLVTARKYRPSTFSSVSGQEHVTRTLQNAIEQDRVGHAYLFSGPRGVGKTSIARIFSKALNCDSGPTTDPCLECSNCTDITRGTSIAVREIDGASHNSVDNVRELIESFRSLPPPGAKHKIYIIDEVHMLSTAAFNALLKSLEEPPPNTIFILATTEPHKIPDTVISRCQRHDFRALGQREIVERLQDIAKQEGLEVEDEAVLMVARLADGSMRDAQSLFDRVRSFCSGPLTAEEAGLALGTVNRQVLSQLSRSIFQRQPDSSLEIIDRAFSTGIDPGLFLKEFVSHWRTLLVAGYGTDAMLIEFGASQDEVKEFGSLIEGVDKNDLQDLVRIAREGAEEATRSQYPRYALEALVVRMATRLPVKDLGELLGKMRSIIRGGAKAARQPGKQQRPEARPYAPGVNAQATKEPPTSSAPPSEPDYVRIASEMSSNGFSNGAGEQGAPEPTPPALAEQGPPAPKAKPLNWERFVVKGCKSVSPIMLQHLKRLHARTFTSGVLELVGPPLSLVYFREKENADKLHRLLESFYKADSWQLTLLESEVESVTLEPGSLLHEQKKGELEKLQKTRERLESHPSVKKFKEAFPGSSIESVRLKQ